LLSFGLIMAMQFFKTQDNASGKRCGESVRFCLDGLSAEETPRRQWIGVFIAVLLLHGVLMAYLRRSPEPEIPAEPLVMEVALLAAPQPHPAQPTPPAPPVAKPKPRPKPVKPKRAPPLPKQPPVHRQPASLPASPPAAADPAPAAQAAAPSTPAASPAAAAKPAVAAPPKTDTFTAANYRAHYKSNPKPEYPRLAKSRGWQGKVLLRVEVTADGHSAGVQVQHSSGHRQLDEAAAEAVAHWTFIPAKRGDTPVASTVTVPIQFKLND
jgi:protein TonB